MERDHQRDHSRLTNEIHPIYLDGDQVFGQWSDVGSIAVTG